MTGETDLRVLLAAMGPQLHSDEFVFYTIPGSGNVRLDFEPLALFREAEGMTVIARRADAQAAGVTFSSTWRLISLRIHSDLEAVGFLAVITQELASAGISTNVISAFYHDHIFVPPAKAEAALEKLRALSSRYQF
jgi:uncharacterized protein